MTKRNYHIVGICGIGMSAIAQILKSYEHNVQGSDASSNNRKPMLESLGIEVFCGHSEKNIIGVDCIVKSTAVSEDNVEIVAAKKLGIPVISRDEILQEILKDKYVIAISGCHGKTTTTGMVGEIFTNAGLDPTIICGGIMNRFQNNVRIGKSEIYILEADESDNTFNKIRKDFAVLTNIGVDHLDFYHDETNLYEKFMQFISDKKSVVPSDLLAKDCIPYDIENGKSKITNITSNGWKTNFDYKINVEINSFVLNAPGKHNVYNAAAAITCAVSHNIDLCAIHNAIENFSGVKRRLSYIGEFMSNKVIDDYAHHPDEIIAGLKALSEITENVTAVIQPHRYTRVKAFFDQYIESFKHVKNIILLDVYPAGERNNGFDSERLYNFCLEHGMRNVILLKNPIDSLRQKLTEITQPGGIIIFMGAGDVTNLAHSIL